MSRIRVPLLVILTFAVVLPQPCLGQSRAHELDRQHSLPTPPTDLGPPILPEDGERLGTPYASLGAGDDEEYWLQFGPYAWGVREYQGSIMIQGEPYEHLLQVWYPGQWEGVDVPAASEGAPFPVVFFSHAGGSYYTWYDYQFSRLATRGIIVISMAHDHEPCPGEFWECHGQLYSETIDLIFDGWNQTPSHFLYQRCDPDRIGLSGHSHGAAFVAMREYRPMNPDGDYEITCVSLIAPCPDYWASLEAFATVYAGMPPLQVIYGSKDRDGCCAHGQSTAMYEVGARPKHFSYVIGASHHVFDEGGPIAEATITREEAFRASGASMAAFHAWMLNGDASALPYLRGDQPLILGEPEVRYQFLEDEALVVDDFEDGEPTHVAAIAGVPGQTFINGFLSDTFVDVNSGVLLIRAEIQALLPAGPGCHSVLFYEDSALGPDVYAEALAAEVAAGLVCEPVFTASQSEFATLISSQNWDLIVAANQDGSGSSTHPFDTPLADYVCNGGKAIISDFRVDSSTADQALLCAQTDFHGSTNWDTMTSTSELFEGGLQLQNPGWGIWTYGLQTDAVTYATYADLSDGSDEHDPSQNSLGLPVTAVNMETFDELSMLNPGRTLYHPTWGLEFAWDSPSAGFIETLADSTAVDGFDASGWSVLSFRILQLQGDPLNPVDQGQDLTVRLEDRDSHQAELNLSDAAQGPLRYAVPPGSGVGWKSILETYRFPLAWFASQNPNLDLTHLMSLSFVCDRTVTGRLIIDDIELVNATATSTISAGLGCVPLSGTLPLPVQLTVQLTNNTLDFARRTAGRIDLVFGDGTAINNWRSGYVNIWPGAPLTVNFGITLPVQLSLVGDNNFTLRAMDVTPAPYNQPPYAPSGALDSDLCTVVGLKP